MFILCGPGPAEGLAIDDLIVVTDPVEHRTLSRTGTGAMVLLNDYCDSGEAGISGDMSLFRGLERALFDESLRSPAMKWAPLACLCVQLRMARFLTLRRAVSNLLRRFTPPLVNLSSGNDIDLVNAAKSACGRAGIDIVIGNGPAHAPSNFIFRMTPFAIPRTNQIPGFTKLAAFCWNLANGPGEILTDAPEQMSWTRTAVAPLRANLHIGFTGALTAKLRRPEPAQRMLARDITFAANTQTRLQSAVWPQFLDPEALDYTARILDYFFTAYPPGVLERTYANLLAYLGTANPSLVVLSHDKIDFFRLIFRACHELGIESAYQPHGIVVEGYSGERQGTPFEPKWILPWTHESAQSYRALGWHTVTTAYRPYRTGRAPYRPLAGPPSRWRVLCMLPDWICATQEGREDCLLRDLLNVVDGLDQCGVVPSSIDFKYHRGPAANGRTKVEALARAEQALGRHLNVLAPETASREIIGRYDLLIVPVTSGIYEAVLLGIPLVVFGMTLDRVGALRDARLPYAFDACQLTSVLSNYNNNQTAASYGLIAAELQKPDDVDAILPRIKAPP